MKPKTDTFADALPDDEDDLPTALGDGIRANPLAWIMLACLGLYTAGFYVYHDPVLAWNEMRGLFSFALPLGMVLEMVPHIQTAWRRAFPIKMEAA